jgi:hypothetical protein
MLYIGGKHEGQTEGHQPERQQESHLHYGSWRWCFEYLLDAYHYQPILLNSYQSIYR